MSSTPDPTQQESSYSTMSTTDVEAIGAHCQQPFCHQLDFLPFRCESCKGNFCLDHRTESVHSCPQAGAWARRRTAANNNARSSTPKPNILTHEQQCSSPSCKTLIHTALVPGIHCEKCRRDYCLKHRMAYDHDCAKIIPVRTTQQKEKTNAALDRLKAWGMKKREALPKAPIDKSKAAAAQQVQELATLKRTAKGDAKVPIDKRVFLHVEAASETVTAKIPKGDFFYSVDWSVGRVLDLAAKSLQVSNLNNRVEGEEDKLRVFHVEGGRLIDFGEKLGVVFKTGDTLVLLRGVGVGMAQTPGRTE